MATPTKKNNASTPAAPAKKTGAQSTQNKTPSQKACGKCGTAQAEFAQDMCKLTDKDIISDVLGTHKSLVKMYGTALCESSCPNMRKLINCKLSECAEDQFDMFLFMNERGLYPTDPAPAQKVQQAKQMYCNESQKMKK